jgi:Uncharacterized protein conserved in archaea
MSMDDIAVGAVVRYPRTGTTGKVVKIEEIDGREYAEIDTTGLYYLLDELIRTELTEEEARKKGALPRGLREGTQGDPAAAGEGMGGWNRPELRGRRLTLDRYGGEFHRLNTLLCHKFLGNIFQ